MINRKKSFKECILCSALCKNISDHIQKTHIPRNDPNYDKYVRTAEVVPQYLTKKVNGITSRLAGEEVSIALKLNEATVTKQTETLKVLKELRETITTLKEEINCKNDEHDGNNLRELCNAEERYKSERYKDQRVYTNSVRKWK